MPNRVFESSALVKVRRAASWFPVLYLAILLVAQLRADWPALAQPRLDVDTVLAVSASTYLAILLGTYRRKPRFLADRHDLVAIITTVIAIDAFGVIARQPITQGDAYVPAGILIILGTALAGWSAMSLGKSFSLLPQARNLVMIGPYAFLRHPMYAGGILITLGELWLRWTPLTLVVCGVAFVAQLVRLQMEEHLLTEQFPSYAAYRNRTSALIPGVY
ncbi:MAG: methyltransferase family protein [Chloroflexota bacterium]